MGNVVYDLNSRIVISDIHTLLIFKDRKQLNLYKRYFGKDPNILLLTEYEVDNGRTAGLRYNYWKYINEDKLYNMINQIIKRRCT